MNHSVQLSLAAQVSPAAQAYGRVCHSVVWAAGILWAGEMGAGFLASF